MSNQLPGPKENDNIDCHLQRVGMGTLICRAAQQTGNRTTNEVNPTICFNCPAGKIFREVGCDVVIPKIRIYQYIGGYDSNVETLFCKIRKRETTLDFCRTCGLVTAETTREIISVARDCLKLKVFTQPTKISRRLERQSEMVISKMRLHSIACLEKLCAFVMKIRAILPSKKQVSDLWKSTRSILRFDELDPSEATLKLMNALSGVVNHLGGLRNKLGDAHGKGIFSPDVSETIAELAINTASTLSTAIIRRFNQIKGGSSNERN